MEALEHEKVKESRTEKLLRQLNMSKENFLDPKLPTQAFSYSQYTSYKICAKAYEFKYVQKLDSGASAPMVRGVSVHAGVEQLLRKKMAGEEMSFDEAWAVAEAKFEEGVESIVDWAPDEDGGPTGPEKLKTQVKDLLRKFTAEALVKINPIGIEEGFAVKIGDVPMVGWIDLVDQQPAIDITGMSAKDAILAPKKTVIVDFKTTTKTWGAIQVRKNPQLTLYAAVKNTPHVRIDQLVATKQPKYVRAESERTADDIAVLSEDINETASFIKQGVFPKASVDNWCCDPKHCAFWDKCRGRKR